MNCPCHSEPMYWLKDGRKKRGGWWECAVKRREISRRLYAKNRERKLARQRDRYDHDPIYRIEKNLHDGARRRRQNLERRRSLASDNGG